MRNSPQTTIAAALRFPPEHAGQSLADIVKRDLDAALQLLTDRAQYITGASGAAIALKRNGMNDMLCRASTGENAPELGALLSTEYGLSGESVRTRQALRCDNAEQDARVNREVCRQLGIASVVVMPVVHDDEVLGVFELFSGKANAFGERDLSAVQRLTEMVQTAVRLASAAEQLPEKLNAAQAAPDTDTIYAGELATVEEDILDEQILEIETVEAVEPAVKTEAPVQKEAQKEAQEPAHIPEPKSDVVAAPGVVVAATSKSPEVAVTVSEPAHAVSRTGVSVAEPKIPTVEIGKADAPAPAPGLVSPKKKLFWSAALDLASEAGTPESDQSHVPPVLRGLGKCEACGFPVSAGRVLCVECEEKKWRGQLRKPAATGNGGSAAAISTSAAARVSAATMVSSVASAASMSVPVVPQNGSAAKGAHASSDTLESGVEKSEAVLTSPLPGAPAALPEFVLSAVAAPSSSWISSHKYIVIAVLVAAAVVAIFLSR
ncbi:MAG: GAF domain-containing protein [Candidatus Sulfotelmatobacter sp.]